MIEKMMYWKGQRVDMKLIVQSLVISFVIHCFYILGALVVGYLKTRNYRPDIEGEWKTVEILQQKTAFGAAVSPLVLVISFIGTALICGIILFVYRKIAG